MCDLRYLSEILDTLVSVDPDKSNIPSAPV
jgi:hypothetical protein